MTDNQIEKEISTAGMSFPAFLFRIIGSIVGGIVGSLVLVLFVVLASAVLSPILSNATDVSTGGPVFVFIVMIMVFLATALGNITATLLISLTDREKYKRRSTALTQIAVMSIIVLLFMVPVYFITSTINLSLVAYAVALHMILTVMTSALTLEIVSNYKYSLVGLYGVTLSIIVSAGVLFLFTLVVSEPTILLFAALPIIWGSMGLVQSITSMIYASLAKLYDKDFLSTQTMYGDDYGKDVEEEAVIEEKPLADEEGASFLRHE